MIELAIGAITIIAIVLFLNKDSKKAQENAASYVPTDEEQAQDGVGELWSGSSIEEKTESVEESKIQIEERLSKIASPDKDKPFANLSNPDASEVPTYPEVISEDKSESVITEKPVKKKRYYKPKKKSSEFPIVSETADKPVRKPYKKRTPKKDE